MSVSNSHRIAVLATCFLSASTAFAREDIQSHARKQFGAISAVKSHELNRPEVQLGRKLFWDARISGDGKTSCASCHTADAWASDARQKSIDARGKPTPRNSLTVFNSMGQPALRWLADRDDGAKMAEGLLTGPMGFDSLDAAKKRLVELAYEAEFKLAFAGDATPLSTANFGKAIAAYQATLVTPAPYDQYVLGDTKALSEKQKKGLQRFVESGCGGCHAGALFGGTSSHKFGIHRDYWDLTGSSAVDVGRAAVTKRDEDRHVFRVPMLRNVAKTGPYFHDGSVANLGDAVRIMGQAQLGKNLDKEAVAEIVEFLGALTGPVPAHFKPEVTK